jgi:CDP-glucose 4,6-dehydratase
VEDLGLNPAFWAGRRVLVTGHTGFKGAWLSLWLAELGAQVTGYALAPPTEPSLFELAKVADRLTSVIADVRDARRLEATLQRARPEVVFHLAAQSLVREGYANPVETYDVNVMGTVRLLEAVRYDGGVRALVNVTSDKCYDNRGWVWGYREVDPLGGADPYSSSKGCAELVTAAYRRSYLTGRDGTVALASARAGNVIGGGDWARDRLLPDACTAFAAGRPVRIRRPDAVRPWQHVLEPLRGYLMLAERLWDDPEAAGPWNFGPDDRDVRPVRWVVERAAALWGDGAGWEADTDAHPHEAAHLALDCAQAHARLGWRPRWGLEEGLAASVAWYKARHEGKGAAALTLGQIRAYGAAS